MSQRSWYQLFYQTTGWIRGGVGSFFCAVSKHLSSRQVPRAVRTLIFCLFSSRSRKYLCTINSYSMSAIDSQLGNEVRSAELAIIISYPTSASGIIVLFKTPPKYRKLDYNKNKKAQEITHTLAIFVDHGIMARIP